MSNHVSSFERFADRLLSLFQKKGWACLLVSLLLFAIFRGDTAVDPDLFARVAAGRLVATTGVALHDPFAFTQTKPMWIDHEWLSGWLYYQLARSFDDFGLFLFKTIVAGFSILFLMMASNVRRKSAQSILGLIVVAWACSYVWVSTVRSQAVTYLCLPILLLGFALFQRNRKLKYIAILPVIMLLWANSHGGFVVGLGLLFLFGCGFLPTDRVAAAKIFGVLAVSVLATALNPYGFSIYWQYIIEALSLHRATIGEWSRIEIFSMAAVVPMLFAFLVAHGIWIERSRIDLKRDLPAWLLLVASAYFGFKHNRLIAIFYMTAFVFAANYISESLSRIFNVALARKLERVSILLAVMAGIWSLALFIAFFANRDSFSLNRADYPEGALAWLKQNRQSGKVLVDFNNGSYALFRLYPRFKISLDGRYEEVYPDETVKLVSDALDMTSKSQEQSMAKVGPDYALIAQNQSAKFSQRYTGQWSMAYSDDKFWIFERSGLVTEPAHRVGDRDVLGHWHMDF